MAEQKVFTLSQVAQHKSKADCWVVVNGRVLNVTKFLEEHPGGEEVLIESSGKDATKEFEDVGHSQAAKNLLTKYQVGVLQGHMVQQDQEKDVRVLEDPKSTEMRAFVIKDDTSPKFGGFVEFFVPLLVAGSYFAYRFLTRATDLGY